MNKIRLNIILKPVCCLLVIFATLNLCGCFSKSYTSHASVYVDNKATEVIGVEGVGNNTANLYDLTTPEMLVDTYIEILNSHGFFMLIKEKTNVPYSAKQIREMVSYSRVGETGVIRIYVTAPMPEDAYEICNAILDNANYQIMNIMEVGSVKTIEAATMPVHPCQR